MFDSLYIIRATCWFFFSVLYWQRWINFWRLRNEPKAENLNVMIVVWMYCISSPENIADCHRWKINQAICTWIRTKWNWTSSNRFSSDKLIEYCVLITLHTHSIQFCIYLYGMTYNAVEHKWATAIWRTSYIWAFERRSMWRVVSSEISLAAVKPYGFVFLQYRLIFY